MRTLNPTPNPDFTLDTVAARALSMVGAPIPYVLSTGGRNPLAPSPIGRKVLKDGTVIPGCDCSGFTAWCCGMDRFQETFPLLGGWVNTDAMMGRWSAAKKLWCPINGWYELLDAPIVGCIVVFGAIDLDADGDRDRIGHTGIVTRVPDNGSWGWRSIEVTHCSSSNWKRSGGKSSISTTDGSAWAGQQSFRGRVNPRWGSIFLKPRMLGIG